MKPNSKIIQTKNAITFQKALIEIVRCEDESIWERFYHKNSGEILWQCILEAPTPPKSDLPAVGSRWRRKEARSEECEIDYHQINVIEKDDEGDLKCEGYDLEDFLDTYEPIPQEPKEGERNDE